MRKIVAGFAIAAILLLAGPPVLRAVGFDTGPNIPLNDAVGQFWSLATQADSSNNQSPIVATQGQRATSTEIAGSVTTGGTFQAALASSAVRKGCTIQNTQTSAVLYVFFGATGSATEAKSFQVAAGASISCQQGSVVLTDNVAVTAAASSATFVVNSQ